MKETIEYQNIHENRKYKDSLFRMVFKEKEDLLDFVKKYRYILLIVLVGVLLMLTPETEEKENVVQTEVIEKKDFQESLEDILEQISGAGKVEVLLTHAAGEEICYQLNEDRSGDDLRKDTVVVTDVDRNETGLIKQVNPPRYLGALVVCQGADNANVKLSIVKAVMSLTGLTSNQITVLKMK